MAKFFKLSALFAFAHCLTFKHVFASPDQTKAVTAPTPHPLHHPLYVRAQPDDPECHVEPYNAPQITKQTFPPFDPATADIYRYRQQQSVNLGSWFVHEKWMTPSLFSCASGSQQAEIDIAYGWWSIDNARTVLEKHWDTFINETDFQYLASIGINTVRLPIGYWNLGPDFMQATPFESVAQVYRDCWPRIVRAINWAGDAGIGVLVDLHGAVGSQNGQQHSGISDNAVNLFSVPSNMDKTMDVLKFLTEKLAAVNNVVGIQILNEPQYVNNLEEFYSRAIDVIRQISKTLPLYLHDGFDLDRFSNFVVGRADFVVQDHHSYFVFTDSDRMERASQHIANIQGAIAESFVRVADRQHRNLVIDEWSCALTSESLQNEDDADQARKNFCAAQLDVYTNTTAGWGFWSYKKEGCENDPDWCFLAAVGHRLPSTFFSYPLAQRKFRSHSSSWGRRGEVVATRPIYHHRFESIQRRRDKMQQYPAEVQLSRGYIDGFTTAKIFASNNMSKLGFTGQYVTDQITKAGPSFIEPGTEENYKDGFMHGLMAGENAVTAATS